MQKKRRGLSSTRKKKEGNRGHDNSLEKAELREKSKAERNRIYKLAKKTAKGLPKEEQKAAVKMAFQFLKETKNKLKWENTIAKAESEEMIEQVRLKADEMTKPTEEAIQT